ncbi:hypothetical protein Dimus_039019 [Dionaea muscipula]
MSPTSCHHHPWKSTPLPATSVASPTPPPPRAQHGHRRRHTNLRRSPLRRSTTISIASSVKIASSMAGRRWCRHPWCRHLLQSAKVMEEVGKGDGDVGEDWLGDGDVGDDLQWWWQVVFNGGGRWSSMVGH